MQATDTEPVEPCASEHCASEPVHDEIPIAIKSGVVIACFLNEYDDEEPQLGRVTEDPGANSGEVEVEWMVGAYSKPWKVWKQRKGQTWKEKVPLSSVLFPVVLDDTSKLSIGTTNKLKLTYQQLRAKH